ncbi:BcPIO4 [Sclerotinia borealis F-4128]|uniref:BcPIO4 n=1 Tax=Sclerotinia borealis (strain F-4128) TaxID=1432307 RepID=W9CFC4_SCLBF|nr:BcPIO4 [Sclerotinia borealis F-4128]
MDKIKAILHGTTPQYEKEVKEEKKAEKAEEKVEKKIEKHGSPSTTSEGSRLGNNSHSTTHPTTGATHTSHTTNVNPTPAGVGYASGGLGQNTMKTDYNSTPTDGPLTTHGRHAERENVIGSDGVNVPHRPRDSEFGPTTATGASGLGGVGNGSSFTGPNTSVHGINSSTHTSEAGLMGHNARDPLSSHDGGVLSNTTSGLGGVTSVPSGNQLDTHGRDNIGSHGTSSHYGRDAILGSGAVGAAGLAEHEHRKHENTGLASNNQTYGHAEDSRGPHNSAALNAADPRVDSHNNTSAGYGTRGAYGTNTTGSSERHLGRDAGAVGTTGAVGEGIHHHNNQYNQGGLIGRSNGPHTTETANLLDPNLSNSGVHTEGAHTHHGHGTQSKGRVEGGGAEEADGVHGAKGTSAGAGIVPVGAYESGRGHNTTAGPHSSNSANKADPRVDSDLSKQQDHHYGRDAVVAGGVGGAAYETNKLHHNSASTTAGPHSSNLENKVDPRVDSNRSREQHQYGRDASLGGGAGTATYEADRHHHNTANTTAGPHSSNLENKADPRVDSDRSKEGHHYGRDAALGGAAAGTAYEANKHHNTHGADQKPFGKDIGDKLHGVERNRGVNGPTGFPHESSHSTTAGAVGTGVPGAPRGNVQDTHNTHGHHSNNTDHPMHNSATGPDHIFTAPVMDDPEANFDLREGNIDQHDHRHGGVAGVGNDDHIYSTGGGHEHSKSRELENDINSAPLGNTSTTPGSGLRDNTYNTSSGTTGLNHGSGLTGHNTTSSGTSGLNHGSGLTDHNSTSSGTLGLKHGSDLTGHNTRSTGVYSDAGFAEPNISSTGTSGLNHSSGHNTTSSGFNRDSGLTGSSGTHGMSGENRLGESSEFGNNSTNNRIL